MWKISEVIRSRKFWAMVTAVIGALSAWLTGELTATIAIPAAIAAVMTWVHAQGRVDAAERTAGMGFGPDDGVDIQ